MSTGTHTIRVQTDNIVSEFPKVIVPYDGQADNISAIITIQQKPKVLGEGWRRGRDSQTICIKPFKNHIISFFVMRLSCRITTGS
jgi:hypothetical protein